MEPFSAEPGYKPEELEKLESKTASPETSPADNFAEKNTESLNDGSIEKVKILVDAETRLQKKALELATLDEKIPPQERVLRKKLLEAEILDARGDIFSVRSDLSTESILEGKNKIIKEESREGIPLTESPEDAAAIGIKKELLGGIEVLREKSVALGYDLDSIMRLEYSDDPEKEKIYKEFQAFAETLKIETSHDTLLDKYPSKLLEIVGEVQWPYLQKEILDSCLKNKKADVRDILDTVFRKLSPEEISPDLIKRVEERIGNDRQEAIKKFSVEDILLEWERETPITGGWTNFDVVGNKIGERLDKLLKEKNYTAILSIKERLDALRSETDNVPPFSLSYPSWLSELNIGERTSLKLLTQQLDEKEFRSLFGYGSRFVPFHVIPESFSPEEKMKYYNRIFEKRDLSPAELEEYLNVTHKNIFQVVKENPHALVGVLQSETIREKTFNEILSIYRNEDSLDESPQKRTKKILESFLPNHDRKELPPLIFETLERFEDKYGAKGQGVVSLAISAYGVEHPEVFAKKLQSIERILDRYNPDTIPEGAKVSMGIEYEVTQSIAETYQEGSLLGYKADIELVSTSANIGRGNDSIHEIALKPNYNPYMLMAEIKLLQDGGFLDFNFEQYPQASRGYHLSLVGDRGLRVDPNMHFLNNIMTMAQLNGITAGKDIKNTKDIYSKNFEHFSNIKQSGDRCEIKGMATDSVEQFEKAVLTAHHAGVAIQLFDKYVDVTIPREEVGETPQEFERMLIETHSLLEPFATDQERNIVYEWARLKQRVVDAVEQHNESFVESEFSGFVLDKKGNYVDTSEDIDVERNKKLVDETTLRSEEFREGVHLNPKDLFTTQQPNFVNALIHTNNIFLKPPQEIENAPVNARAALDAFKKEGHGGLVGGEAKDSIFDKRGELRRGYYYTQGASEEMIIHKAQILLDHFNMNMEKYLDTKGVERTIEQNELVAA